MTRPKPKAPLGVVRSPSCLCLDTPCCPSHAGHVPATDRHHAPALRQSRRAPRVEARYGETTVTSWLADPVASPLASDGGQSAGARSPPAAEAGRHRARHPASANDRIGRSDYASMSVVLVALVLLQPPF